MPKTRTTPANPASPDKYEEFRHRICAPPELIDALDAIAKLNQRDERGPQNRSKIMCGLGVGYVRKNRQRLKNSGFVITPELAVILNGKSR
jgi:hypothetical protein